MAIKPRLLEELVIKVNSKALTTAKKAQTEVSERMIDAAQGAEMLSEQIGYINIGLLEAQKSSRGLANNLEAMDRNTQMADKFDEVVAAIQEVSGEMTELVMLFEDFAHASSKGADESVVSMEKLLDGLRDVEKATDGTAGSSKDYATVLKQLIGNMEKYNKQNEKNQRNPGARGFQSIAKLAGPLPALYAVIAANVYALTAAYEYLASGDRLNRLERINNVIGQETGVLISNLADRMMEATGYALSYDAAMQKAAQASAFGFSPDQVEEFTLAARRASVALGVDLDDAMNRIIRGVSKMEIELLDELGITVRLTEAYENYQRELGVTQNSLTGYQRQQAYANAVIKESTDRFGKLDKEMKATSWEKLIQNVDQSNKNFQKLLARGLSPVAEAFNSIFETSAIDKMIERTDRLTEGLSKAAERKNLLQQASMQQEGEKDIIDLEQEILDLGQKRLTHLQQLEASEQRLNKLGMSSGGLQASRNKVNAEYDSRIRQINKSIEKFNDQLDQNFGHTLKQQQGTESYSKQIRFMGITLKEFQQLSKSLPEVMQQFDASIKSPVTEVEKLSGALTSAAENIKNLKISRDQIDPNSAGASAAYAKIDGNIQLNLKKQQVETEEELQINLAKSAELIHVKTVLQREEAKTQQQIAANNQFSVGTIQEQLQLKEELRVINKELQAGSVQEGKGAIKDLMSQEDINQSVTRRIAINAQLKSSQQSLNATYADMQSMSSSIQASQAEVGNGDPLKIRLKGLNDELNILRELQKQNQGIQKPEEALAREDQINAKLLERKGILAEIDARSVTTNVNLQEEAKYRNLMGAGAKDLLGTEKQEVTLLESRARTLEQSLKNANKYGATQDEISGITRDIQQNEYDILQAKLAVVDSKYATEMEQLSLNQESRGQRELETLSLKVGKQFEYIDALKQENAGVAKLNVEKQKLLDLETQLQNAKQADKVEGLNNAFSMLPSSGSVPNIQAPTQIGEPQLKEQEMQTQMGAINTSLSELSQYNPAFADMITNVTNLGLAFKGMGEGAVTGQQVAQAGMATIASMLAMTSQQTVKGYDDQIQAEKARDGKSAESQKKLKKLEAEKAAQQKKAQIQQIVMQTAMGVTQALQSLPPPYSFVMAGLVGTMGLQALKSAQSGTSIPDTSSGTTPSLSLGERDNRVDVSQGANGGELAYLQGQQGVGTVSNFKPRAVGNRAPANHQVLLGENGPEVASFTSDATITPQHRVGSGGGSGGGNNFYINAMDSSSFEEFLQRNGNILEGQMENQLNSTGNSLFRR